MASTVIFDDEEFTVEEEPSRPETALHLFSQTAIHLVLLGVLTPVLAPVAGMAILLGKPFTSRLSAFWLPRVMGFVDSRLRAARSQCLKSVQGKVIDVGCAHGGYLSYYSKNADKLRHITMLEPNALHNRNLHENIERCRALNPRMREVEIVVSNRFLEDLPPEENETYDWVILGNVMCEIPQPTAAVLEIDRLLKKGGRAYFCEHVAHEQGTWMRFLQEMLSPLWVHVSDGCNLNRCSLHTLQSQGWRMHHWSFMRNSIVPMKVGLAVKNTNS